MSLKYIFLAVSVACISPVLSSAQNVDRRDVRKGNRDFKKEDYKAAEIDYRKALVKDSLSFAAGYNLGNTLYRMEDKDQAGKIYGKLAEQAAASPYASDYYYNTGNVAADSKDWQAAVDAYKQALLRNPSDMDAKENYIYAKEMLKNQQNQDKDNQDNKDNQNQDNRNQDQDNQDRNQDNQDQNQQDQDRSNGGQQPKITPQAAQQMLQAIQAKEKETQDKVKKEKAQVLKSRQKEKNW